MGRVVTMVTKTPPDRFLAAGWPWLVGMAVVVVIVRPAVTLTRYLITNQAIAAPFTGMIRWQSHWHVVRQSWAFFQNDFAGRISNRVMQTGAVGALDADRDHHHRLVHYCLWRFGRRPYRRG